MDITGVRHTCPLMKKLTIRLVKTHHPHVTLPDDYGLQISIDDIVLDHGSRDNEFERDIFMEGVIRGIVIAARGFGLEPTQDGEYIYLEGE